MTLKELGHEADLSHPFLSQLERGLARPSVGSVERIAAALDVSVSALWSPPRRGGAARRAQPARVRAKAACAPSRARPRRCSCTSGPATADEGGPVVGEVVLYVARGSVELDLGGKTHRLGEGDALFFDGATPHKLRNTGDDDTRALFVANGA